MLNRFIAGLAVLVVVSVGAPAQVPSGSPDLNADDLVRMSQCELEALYRAAEWSPLPLGFAPGQAIPAPGTAKTVRQSRLIGVLWKGKVIRPDGVMINRGPLGLKAVKARIFVGDSWLDGRPTLVMDYCGMSRLFADVRDELREVAPGLYLGLTYRRDCPSPRLAMFFVLDTRCR